MTQELFEDLGIYIGDKYNITITPICIVSDMTKIYLYYYCNNVIDFKTISGNDDDIYELFLRHRILGFSSYISNKIIPKKLTLVEKTTFIKLKFVANVYATDNISFLYIGDTNSSRLNYAKGFKIDYTDNNFDLIDNI